MLFWSGIWHGKLIFPKIIFKVNFIYFKNIIWVFGHIYSVELLQHDRPLDGSELGLGWSRHTCTGPSPGLAAGGAKNQKGGHIFIYSL